MNFLAQRFGPYAEYLTSIDLILSKEILDFCPVTRKLASEILLTQITWSMCVTVRVYLFFVTALRIHISKQCYIGLSEICGYDMTLRGEMNVKVSNSFRGHP